MTLRKLRNYVSNYHTVFLIDRSGSHSLLHNSSSQLEEVPKLTSMQPNISLALAELEIVLSNVKTDEKSPYLTAKDDGATALDEMVSHLSHLNGTPPLSADNPSP